VVETKAKPRERTRIGLKANPCFFASQLQWLLQQAKETMSLMKLRFVGQYFEMVKPICFLRAMSVTEVVST